MEENRSIALELNSNAESEYFMDPAFLTLPGPSSDKRGKKIYITAVDFWI